MTYVVSLLHSLNISDKELAYADPSFSSTPGLNSSKLGFSLCKISPRISYFGYVFKIHVNTLPNILGFFWATVDLPMRKGGLAGYAWETRLGHVNGNWSNRSEIGRVGPRSKSVLHLEKEIPWNGKATRRQAPTRHGFINL